MCRASGCAYDIAFLKVMIDAWALHIRWVFLTSRGLHMKVLRRYVHTAMVPALLGNLFIDTAVQQGTVV